MVDSLANLVLPVITFIHCFVEHFPLRLTVIPLHPNIMVIVLFAATHTGNRYAFINLERNNFLLDKFRALSHIAELNSGTRPDWWALSISQRLEY